MPFCWVNRPASLCRLGKLTNNKDRFTTDFFLPDGSYGSIAAGNFTSASGDTANLITGVYRTSGGKTGNLYSAPSLQPDTAALPIPTPWTSKGVGTAIPASQLGGLITYTTTVPGGTVAPSTVVAQTISMTGGYGLTLNATTTPASTVPGTSQPPMTAVITTTQPSITPSVSESARRLSFVGRQIVHCATFISLSVTLLTFCGIPQGFILRECLYNFFDGTTHL